MAESNQNITFKGEKVAIGGSEVKVGDIVPDFTVVANDLSDLNINAFADKVVIISSVPSIDTAVCQVQTKRFNEEATNLSDDIVVLTISTDLPFAQKRWCGAEGVENVVTASDYKYRTFRENFGVIWEGPQLLARAVFVVAKDGKIAHVDYADDITSEPDYDKALEAAKALI